MILVFGSINVDLIVPVPHLAQPGETVSTAGENAIAVSPGANFDTRSDWIPDELIDANTILLAQMEVPLAETKAMIGRVRQRGGRCVLNLAPALPIDLMLLSQIDLLIANEREAPSLATDPASAARRLRCGIVITRGAAGATAILADGVRLDVPALAVDPVDTTGAGDTFAGVLAAGLDLGRSLEAALLQASAAAGLACRAHGAQTAMPYADSIAAAAQRLATGRN